MCSGSRPNELRAYGIRVLDVGCGWGLAGIHCARYHESQVTAVDLDSRVFPFLQLQSRINDVRLRTTQRDYNHVTREHLEDMELMIGADVCFCESQVQPLKELIYRALQAGVENILIADPGRPIFRRLAGHFVGQKLGHQMEWSVRWPYWMQGAILRLDRFAPGCLRKGIVRS